MTGASKRPLRSLRASFYRGGTSKALVLLENDLPSSQAEWSPILLSAMGSPDPNARQLDGMGGGLSSLSKVCVVKESEREDADVDYTFIQVRFCMYHYRQDILLTSSCRSALKILR